MSIYRDWSRSGINPCNPKNQICTCACATCCACACCDGCCAPRVSYQSPPTYLECLVLLSDFLFKLLDEASQLPARRDVRRASLPRHLACSFFTAESPPCANPSLIKFASFLSHLRGARVGECGRVWASVGECGRVWAVWARLARCGWRHHLSFFAAASTASC